MRVPKISHLVLPAVAALLVGAILQSAFAQPTPAAAGPSVKVSAQRSRDSASTGSDAFGDIPGASTSIVVPVNTRALLLASFNTVSSCEGVVPGDTCQVKIIVQKPGGAVVEMQPGGSDPLRFFDTVSQASADDRAEAHGIERSLSCLSSGNYLLRAQWRVTGEFTTFFINGFHLSVIAFGGAGPCHAPPP